MQNMVKKKVALDYEWISLIKEAKTMGITMEEVREFLEKPKGEGNG